MILKCPVDAAILQESTKGGLPHWMCPTCQGRLVFRKTFRYARLAKGAPDIDDEIAAGADSPDRKCSNCLSALKVFKLKQEEGEPIDVHACTRCHWLWFEQGHEFGAKGAEREQINKRFEDMENAYRRFRYWHTFRDWGSFGAVVPWAIWAGIVALMIRTHIEMRTQTPAAFFYEDSPFRNTILLVAALVLTISAKRREGFVLGLLLAIWAA